MVSRERTRKFKSRLICWLALGKYISYLGVSKERAGLVGSVIQETFCKVSDRKSLIYTVKELLSTVGYSRLF